MSSRYERAGTIGFRCVQDVPVAEQSSCTAPLCGSFEPPSAFVDLSKSAEWAAWGVSGSSTVIRNSGSAGAISDVAHTNASLTTCRGQLSFSWTDGSGANATTVNNTRVGVCQANGGGIALTVTSKPGKHTFSVFASSQAASFIINATLTDGGEPAGRPYNELLSATAVDMAAKVWYNIRFNLDFTTKTAGAALKVHLAAPQSNGHYAPLPPPPPLPPCATPLCGNFAPLQPGQKVDLSALGTADWAHFGDKKATATIAGAPLPYAAAGAAVPTDPTDKSLFSLAGGASLVGSQAAGFTDLRSGSPGKTAVVTLTAHLEGAGHNIDGFSMTFRYIAGERLSMLSRCTKRLHSIQADS